MEARANIIRKYVGASEERILFQKYLNQEMNLTDIALSCGIEYHSAVKKITKIRKSVKQEIAEILEVTSCHVAQSKEMQ